MNGFLVFRLYGMQVNRSIVNTRLRPYHRFDEAIASARE